MLQMTESIDFALIDRFFMIQVVAEKIILGE